jgi:hypothetical protein
MRAQAMAVGEERRASLAKVVCTLKNAVEKLQVCILKHSEPAGANVAARRITCQGRARLRLGNLEIPALLVITEGRD